MENDVIFAVPDGVAQPSVTIGLLGAVVDNSGHGASSAEILHARFCEIERRILAIEAREKLTGDE